MKPRPGLLDPQGKAIQHALESLGYAEAKEVRVGKVIDIELLADGEEAAVEQGREMCRKLLANPVTEDFEVALAQGLRPGGRAE